MEKEARLLALSLVCDCLPEGGAEQVALLASYSVTAEAVATARKGSGKVSKPTGQENAPSWHAEIEGKEAFAAGGGGGGVAASAPAQQPPAKKAKVVSTAAKTAAAKNASVAAKKGQMSMASFFGAPKKK